MDIEQVPASEWNRWIEKNNGLILDVREPREWALGTLPGALRISMGALPRSLETLDKGANILVVCRSGNRSQQVAAFMKMSGFESVANMAGGMKALGWQP